MASQPTTNPEPSNMASQPTTNPEPSNTASQPTTNPEPSNLASQPTTNPEPSNTASQPIIMPEPSNLASQSITIPEPSNLASQPITTLEPSNLASQPITIPELSNLASQPITTLEPSNLASQPITIPELSNLASQPITIPEPSNLASQPITIPEPSNLASQPITTLEPSNLASQPITIPEPSNMASQPITIPELSNTASQPITTPEPSNMASQSNRTPKVVRLPIRATKVARLPTRTPKVSSQPTRTPKVASLPTRTPKVASLPTRTPKVASLPTRTPKVASLPTRTPKVASLPTRTPKVASLPTRTPKVASLPTRTPKVASLPTRTPKVASLPTRTPKVASLPTRTPKVASLPTRTPKVASLPTRTPKVASLPTRTPKVASLPTRTPKVASLPTRTPKGPKMASQPTTTPVPTNTANQPTPIPVPIDIASLPNTTAGTTNMGNQPNIVSGPATTAIQPTSVTFGLKLIKMHYAVARSVMYKVFCLGTPNKSLQQDFMTYLNNLRPPSTANYLNATSGQRKFDGTQKQQITKDPSCKVFDITLLLQCIKIGCEGVVGLGDSVWHTDGTQLENCLYMIKRQRNEAMHEPLEMTQADFKMKEIRLRQVLINTLTAVQQRYNHSMTTALRDQHIQEVHDDLDRIRDSDLNDTELLTYCSHKLLYDLQQECREELEKRFSGMRCFNPVSFIMCSNLSVDVTLVYTDIEIEHDGRQGTRVVTYQDFLVEIQESRVVLLEGMAGAGKTTLLTLMLQQWCAGHGNIKDLDTYHVVLHIVCRDPSTTNYEQLLRRSLPETCTKYSTFTKFPSLTEPLLAQCRFLVLIDGLDEATSASRELVKDVLHQLHAANATIICTSRPEKSEDFHNMAGQLQPVTHTRIKGIPEDKRVEFVEKNHLVMKQQTCSGQDTVQLVHLMKELVKHEHFRLPLNLLLAVWVWDQEPGALGLTTTQIELYYHTHCLSKKKLHQRLTNHPDTCNMDHRNRNDMVEAWEPELCQELLVALSRDQLALPMEAERRLRSACATHGLPPQEMLGAFLSLKSTTPGHQQYSAPHKALQEYYGALHVVRTIQSHPGSSIIRVMEKTLGEGQVKLQNYINLLQHVAGLLHLHMDHVPGPVVKEVVELLYKAGVRSKDQWLDLLENIKASSAIIEAIAKLFPSDITTVVRDSRLTTYSILLPHLPERLLDVDIRGDPTHLLPGLSHHPCEVLHLWQHWYHPQPTPTPDHSLHNLLSRINLEVFTGQGTVGLSMLPSRLSVLSLSLAEDSQAKTLLPLLHPLKYLKYMKLHLAAAVSPAAITSPLPKRVSVNLYLSDVSVEGEWRACEVAARLQPPPREYDMLLFPRATMSPEGWRRILQGLIRRGVRVWQEVAVPDDPDTEDRQLDPHTRIWLRLEVPGFFSTMDQQLDTLARTKLGAGFARRDFTAWERQ